MHIVQTRTVVGCTCLCAELHNKQQAQQVQQAICRRDRNSQFRQNWQIIVFAQFRGQFRFRFYFMLHCFALLCFSSVFIYRSNELVTFSFAIKYYKTHYFQVSSLSSSSSSSSLSSLLAMLLLRLWFGVATSFIMFLFYIALCGCVVFLNTLNFACSISLKQIKAASFNLKFKFWIRNVCMYVCCVHWWCVCVCVSMC